MTPSPTRPDSPASLQRAPFLVCTNMKNGFQYARSFCLFILMSVKFGVYTLALTVAKTSSHYDGFAISVPARSLLLFDLAQQDENISDPKGPRGTRGNGEISEARFIL